MTRQNQANQYLKKAQDLVDKNKINAAEIHFRCALAIQDNLVEAHASFGSASY